MLGQSVEQTNLNNQETQQQYSTQHIFCIIMTLKMTKIILKIIALYEWWSVQHHTRIDLPVQVKKKTILANKFFL